MLRRLLLISIVSLNVHGTVRADDASTTTAPSDREVASEDARIVERSIEILLSRQESLDGNKPEEWPYEGVYRVRGPRGPEIPMGYRVGGTAICAWLLIEAKGWEESEVRRLAAKRATSFILRCLEDERMSGDNSKSYDVRGWGQIYALTYLLRLIQLERFDEATREAVRTSIRGLIQKLEASTFTSVGGWHYSRRGSPSTFMTAAALQALVNAKDAGYTVDDATLATALRSLRDARLETGAFQYASFPARKTGRAIEAIPGSIGRSPICEVTLLSTGYGGIDRVGSSVDQFFKYWRWLDERRGKAGTHRPPYMIAPYYFFFAHFYAAQAIELLPAKERDAYRIRLRKLLIGTRLKGDVWNDRVFAKSQSYCTAIAALALLAPSLPPMAKLKRSQPSSTPKPPGTGIKSVEK